MIRLTVGLDCHGCLKEFSASGHAGSGWRGEDPVCAAASVLLRTAARLLASVPEIETRGGARRRGRMRLTVTSLPSGGASQWVRGVTDFLIRGLRDLQDEHPESVALTVLAAGRGEGES